MTTTMAVLLFLDVLAGALVWMALRIVRGQRRTAARVWARLEAEPGFSEELRQAEADMAAGKGIPFSEVKR